MLANADVTFYSFTDYVKHTAHRAYFTDNRGRTVKKNGIETTDSVTVYLYTDEYVPKPGDIVVNGICPFTFDNSSQQTISDDMKRFRASYPDSAVVKSVADMRFGGLPHIEITAR